MVVEQTQRLAGHTFCLTANSWSRKHFGSFTGDVIHFVENGRLECIFLGAVKIDKAIAAALSPSAPLRS